MAVGITTKMTTEEMIIEERIRGVRTLDAMVAASRRLGLNGRKEPPKEVLKERQIDQLIIDPLKDILNDLVLPQEALVPIVRLRGTTVLVLHLRQMELVMEVMEAIIEDLILVMKMRVLTRIALIKDRTNQQLQII
jgi:hypothetical protein